MYRIFQMFSLLTSKVRVLVKHGVCYIVFFCFYIELQLLLLHCSNFSLFLVHMPGLCSYQAPEKQRRYYCPLLLPIPERETEPDWFHTEDSVTTEGMKLRTNPCQLLVLVLYPHQEPGLVWTQEVY